MPTASSLRSNTQEITTASMSTSTKYPAEGITGTTEVITSGAPDSRTKYSRIGPGIMPAAAIPSLAHSTQCHILDAPPEIRNTIYDLVFAPDTSDPVSLLEATPPQKSLALSCRQIYEESKHIYRTAYRKFWQTANFVVNLKTPEEGEGFYGNKRERRAACFANLPGQIRKVRSRNLAKINHLLIEGDGFHWWLHNKVWIEETDQSVSRSIIVPGSCADRVENVDYRVSGGADNDFFVVGTVLKTEDGGMQPAVTVRGGREITKDELKAAMRGFVGDLCLETGE